MPSKKNPQTEISPEIRLQLLKLIQDSTQPQKPSDLGKAVSLSGPAVQKLLANDLDSGAIVKWGAAYWHRDAKTEARDRILALAAVEAVAEKQILARAASGLPKLAGPLLKSSIQDLLQEKHLYRLPAPKGSKTPLLSDTGHLELYLESEILKLFASVGWERPVEQVRALLGCEPLSKPIGETIPQAAEKLFAAMNRMAFSPGTTVTFYRLRQQPELSGIPKETFDRAALLLQEQRRALLSIHGHALALPTEERDILVTDGSGNYYGSIYAR